MLIISKHSTLVQMCSNYLQIGACLPTKTYVYINICEISMSYITSSTKPFGHFCHLIQLGIYDLVCLSKDSHQVRSLPGIARREECVRCTCTLRATSTSDTVHIIL